MKLKPDEVKLNSDHDESAPLSHWERVGVSDCVGCQAGCHGVLVLSMALRIVSSLRATAIKAT
ncbi:MAG TPA: hypothetical protein VNX23_11110, partial [Bradyrhizobium sp.]|uniref:hypothetical protein n=1 Tax=Bradyrhizobium sp. TaxID=376 RepID=UPI002B9508FE